MPNCSICTPVADDQNKTNKTPLERREEHFFLMSKLTNFALLVPFSFALLTSPARAEVKVLSEKNKVEDATPKFKFHNVPSPSASDLARKAKLTVVDGSVDEAGGPVAKLNNGTLPTEEDQPEENFFFEGDGGRILIDLGKVVEIKQVNSYSWHPAERGAQAYKLYASDGKADGFQAAPKRPIDPETAGWRKVASVDTRPPGGADTGGQYGVSIADSNGSLGKFRYLLMDVAKSTPDDPDGNTFFSEVDVVGAEDKPKAAEIPPAEDKSDAKPADAAVALPEQEVFALTSSENGFRIVLDASATPDVQNRAKEQVPSVVREWQLKSIREMP
jgi:hypothetical protein